MREGWKRHPFGHPGRFILTVKCWPKDTVDSPTAAKWRKWNPKMIRRHAQKTEIILVGIPAE